MGRILLLVAPAVLGVSGCSSLIAGSGAELGAVRTRSEAHQLFGDPIEIGSVEGQPYETFHTRRKIADGATASGYGMAFGMTLGISEVACFPAEVLHVASDMLLGREFSFIYDLEANVVAIHDGPPQSRETREHDENDQSDVEADAGDFQGIQGKRMVEKESVPAKRPIGDPSIASGSSIAPGLWAGHDSLP